MSRRRASRDVSLVLVGAALLQGCGQDGGSMVQDSYKSLEDCQADWGRPEWCERVDRKGAGPGANYYRGPSYVLGSRSSAQRASGGGSSNRSIGSGAAHAPARGGFGASAHGHSGGG